MRKLILILTLISLSLSCRFLSILTRDTDLSSNNQPCVVSKLAETPVVTLDGIYQEYLDDPQASNDITAYLNAGAAIDQLQEVLTGIPSSSIENIKAHVLAQDVTGDSSADVIVSLALPTLPGNGDAMLAVFTCREGQYIRHGLFGRTGAGSRSEGLFESGGAGVIEIIDLNSNGNREIVFFVPSLNELYIAGWDGTSFDSLVQYSDELGNRQSFIQVQEGYFEFEDVNNDSIFEVVVTGPYMPGVWMWDGSYFQPSGE